MTEKQLLANWALDFSALGGKPLKSDIIERLLAGKRGPAKWPDCGRYRRPRAAPVRRQSGWRSLSTASFKHQVSRQACSSDSRKGLPR
jgi:hypothetical protein